MRSDLIGAYLLRRNSDSTWPAVAANIDPAALELPSIGFRAALDALYVGTWLVEHAV